MAAFTPAIACADLVGLLFLIIVLFSGSWTLEEIDESFQEGKTKEKRQGSGKCSISTMLFDLFFPQVVGRWAVASLAAFDRFFLQFVADATAAAFSGAHVGIFISVGMFALPVDRFTFVVLPAPVTMWSFRQAFEGLQQQAAAARGCHNALASEAKASPRVDVGDTTASFREDEHEGKNGKGPSVSDLFPVFVRSLLGPHLVFHVSGCTPVSSLVSDVTARTGVPAHLFTFVVEGRWWQRSSFL